MRLLLFPDHLTENRELRTLVETQGPFRRTQTASGPSPAHSGNCAPANPIRARTNYQTPRRGLRTGLRPGRRPPRLRHLPPLRRQRTLRHHSRLIARWPCHPHRSTQIQYGLYRANAHRRINGRAVPYTLAEIDFFVAYVIPEDSWFIFPLPHILGSTAVTLSPKRRRKPHVNDRYREAWHLLYQPDGLEFA